MTVNKITNAPTQNEVIDKINEVIDNLGGGGTAPVWGNITGTLSNQTDLQSALNNKYDASNPNGYTSNVGTVTSVNSVSPVSGNVTLSIPSDTSDLTNGAGFITSSALSGLADTDLSNLTATGKNVIDGQWVSSYVALASGVSAPTATDLSYSLATYLPNDTYNYEVLLNMIGTTAATANAYSRGYLYSDKIVNAITLYSHRNAQGSSVATTAGGNAIIPIGTERKIYVAHNSANTGTFALNVVGYRRIGTNT